MPSRLLLALAVSLALHASLLLPDAFERSAPPSHPALAASLRLPARAQSVDDDPLLKNTLAEKKARPAVKPLPPPPAATHATPHVAKAPLKREVEATQRKLSEHLYYPPEAVARGIEGEVRLLLTLTDDGGITDVTVASSSGHKILDQAAVRAAWSMGRVNWAHSRELILPVFFRLD